MNARGHATFKCAAIPFDAFCTLECALLAFGISAWALAMPALNQAHMLPCTPHISLAVVQPANQDEAYAAEAFLVFWNACQVRSMTWLFVPPCATQWTASPVKPPGPASRAPADTQGASASALAPVRLPHPMLGQISVCDSQYCGRSPGPQPCAWHGTPPLPSSAMVRGVHDQRPHGGSNASAHLFGSPGLAENFQSPLQGLQHYLSSCFMGALHPLVLP